MKTIHKFQVPVEDFVKVAMPLNAQVLCVQLQHDVPCIWALVEDDHATEIRCFRWQGTGNSAVGCKAEDYVGTVQEFGGTLVWHLFEAR